MRRQELPGADSGVDLSYLGFPDMGTKPNPDGYS